MKNTRKAKCIECGKEIFSNDLPEHHLTIEKDYNFDSFHCGCERTGKYYTEYYQKERYGIAAAEPFANIIRVRKAES